MTDILQGIGVRCKIVDIVNDGRLVHLTSQESDHGMSSGPVQNDERRMMIGMVTKDKGLLKSHRPFAGGSSVLVTPNYRF